MQLIQQSPEFHIVSTVSLSGTSTAQYFFGYSRLTLPTVQEDDTGIYTCVISSGLEDTATHGFQLIVQGGPILGF